MRGHLSAGIAQEFFSLIGLKIRNLNLEEMKLHGAQERQHQYSMVLFCRMKPKHFPDKFRLHIGLDECIYNQLPLTKKYIHFECAFVIFYCKLKQFQQWSSTESDLMVSLTFCLALVVPNPLKSTACFCLILVD